MQNLSSKVTGGILTAAQWNQVPQELQNVITDSGIGTLLSGDLDQVGKAVATYAAASHFLTDSGTSTAYVLGASGNMQLPPAYIDGLLVRFRPGNANTTQTPTVALGALAAKTVKRENGEVVRVGDLSLGRDTYLRFDSTADVWFLSLFSVVQDNPPIGYIEGMTISNSATDLLWDIEVDAGRCADSTGTYLLTLDTATSKDTRIVWTSAASNGAKVEDQYEPSPVTSSSPEWQLWVIGGPTVETSWGIDTGAGSLDAGNLLLTAGAGYTKFRHIGYIQPTGPGGQANHTHLLRFKVSRQDPSRIEYHVQGTELFATLFWSVSSASIFNKNLNLTVPRLATAITMVSIKHNTADLFVKFHEDLGFNVSTGPAPTRDDCTIAIESGLVGVFNTEIDIETDGLSSISGDFSRVKTNDATETMALKVLGFRFDRSARSPFLT